MTAHDIELKIKKLEENNFDIKELKFRTNNQE
jgi:hypothetical protein